MPLNEQGQEVPDDTPLFLEVPGLRPVTQIDDIQRMIREEFSRIARENELETFEDANDFDVEDDDFPVSPHEYTEDTQRADEEAFELLKSAPKQPDEGKPSSGAPPAEGPPPPPPPPAAPPPQ